MSSMIQTQFGTIVYSDDYIASIAGLTTMECYGVVGMASRKASDGFYTLLKKDYVQKGVRVYTDQSNALGIELNVVVEYGVSIGAVANSIIETVRYSVEKATGLVVKDVSVIVSGIRV